MNESDARFMDMESTHTPQMDSADTTTAAPALVVESIPLMRQHLADAIKARDAADDRAAIAAEIAARADEAKIDASLAAERLRQGLDAAQAAAIERHAAALTSAFRTGEALPGAPIMPEVNSAALAAALARLNAFHRSACELATEANAAASEATQAAAAVAAMADSIMNAEAAEIAAELIATHEHAWRLENKLAGIFRLDARRQAPHLHGLEDLLKHQIDIRKREEADNPQLVEGWKWREHLAAIAQQSDSAWQDYARRLAKDPAARLDATEDPTQ